MTVGEVFRGLAGILFVASALLAMYAFAKATALHVSTDGPGRNQKRKEAKLLFIYAGGWAIIAAFTGMILWRG